MIVEFIVGTRLLADSVSAPPRNLLTHPTITAAASAVGAGEKTLRRWLVERDFQAAYRAARDEAVRMAVGRLQGLLATAAETLARTMETGTPPVAVRASVAVFEHAHKGAELLDLIERVRALEESEPQRGEL